MKRNQFLLGITASSALVSIGGCNLFADNNRLRVLGLASSLSSKIGNQFEKEFSKSIELKIEKTPLDLFKVLQEQTKPPESGLFKTFFELFKSSDSDKVPDVIGIGDGWLDLAIAQSLIQPLAAERLAQIPQWQTLDPRWKQLVTRKDRVWGIPYRWGTTAIAYLPEKVKFPINSWADLWRPEIKGRLTLPDDYREVIGLVLKKLGQSYQSADLGSIKSLESELSQLDRQVLTYTSDNYLQILLIDDAWVAVGWSQDLEKARKQNPEIKVIIPSEGTALWSDIWVLPKMQPRSQNLDSAYNWMRYCLKPEIAAQITAFTEATTTSPAIELIPASLKANSVKFPDSKILSQSEILLPLSESTRKQYSDLWIKIRS